MKVALVIALFAVAALATPWDEANAPQLADATNSFQTQLSQLPLSAATAVQPWSDTYWPSQEGGISHRWQKRNPEDFKYKLLSASDVKKASKQDLAVLSPAEKYDIFQGRFDYPTVKSEWHRTNPNDPDWEGICHGWTPAALAFSQPDAVNVTSAQGIVVPFGSSDIKALLSYWTGQVDEEDASQWFVGNRCNTDLDAHPEAANQTECADINAGTFHLLITNLIGLQQKGFAIDRDRSYQVWNQPLFQYSSQVTSTGPTSASVATTISYGKETRPEYYPHDTYVYTEYYFYTLDLDAQGNVVGGDWQEVAWIRPDFTWMTQINDFSGYWSGLATIYAASTKSVARVGAGFNRAMQPRHVSLSDWVGSFGHIHHARSRLLGAKHAPRHIQRTSWSLVPQAEASHIELEFTQLHTMKHRDVIKVYEGVNGEGALIAIIHGSQAHNTKLRIDAAGAYIAFVTDEPAGHEHFSSSFKIDYKIFPRSW